MCRRIGLLAGLLIVLANGCVSAPDTSCGPRTAPRVRSAPAPPSTGEDARPASWFGRSQAKAAPEWEWATGLPRGATRAELMLPVLSETQLASLVPALSTSAIRLASVGPETAGCRITAVNGVAVADCNQLHAAVNRAVAGRAAASRLSRGSCSP
jgi:hypothetical protein